MKGSKDGIYLTPIRHRATNVIYRNGYFDADTRLWHAVDAEGMTSVFPMWDCEFVFHDQSQSR